MQYVRVLMYLYDWYVCVRRGVVEDLWAITARGALY
jgi:hypothetical protein